MLDVYLEANPARSSSIRPHPNGIAMSFRHTAGLLIASLVASTSFAQVPDTLSFQGVITNPGGLGISTTENVTTKLYQGGVEVFSQLHMNVPVDSGVFNVDIGPLGNIRFDRPTELGITIGGNSEMVPRTPLRSTPFSLGLRLPFVATGEAPADTGRHPGCGTCAGHDCSMDR